MAIERRRFLGLAGGVFASIAIARFPAAVAGTARAAYVSARSGSSGSYGIAGFDCLGRVVFDLDLPGRGHDIVAHPSGREAVVFARRPGTFAFVFDLASGRRLATFAPQLGRHFFGHGVFAPDGGFVYATENDFETGRGVIGVYDVAAGYARVGELDSHGIGPHDIALLSDGRTLVVANGGVRTHPDMGRTRLNLPAMSPSLAYVDRFSDVLRDEVRLSPELHQVSLRHLAVARDDTVCVGGQYQGPRNNSVPLVLVHTKGRKAVTFMAPESIQKRMQHYCGSVALDRSDSVIAVSCPRGNLITFWEASSGAFLSHADIADGCGIAPGRMPRTFIATSGLGGVYRIEAAMGVVMTLEKASAATGRWDNHLLDL